MKYMLLVYYNEQTMTDAERERCYLESADFLSKVQGISCYF